MWSIWNVIIATGHCRLYYFSSYFLIIVCFSLHLIHESYNRASCYSYRQSRWNISLRKLSIYHYFFIYILSLSEIYRLWISIGGMCSLFIYVFVCHFLDHLTTQHIAGVPFSIHCLLIHYKAEKKNHIQFMYCLRGNKFKENMLKSCK